MNIFIKIILFILIIFQTNISEAKVFVFDNVVSEMNFSVNIVNTKSESTIILENDFGIICKSERDLVDYRNLVSVVKANATKGGNPLKSTIGAARAGFSKLPKGFKQTKQFGFQHGQKVYEYKGKFYSRDIDGHNGGAWKVFENKGGRLQRIGTADEFLNIFKN